MRTESFTPPINDTGLARPSRIMNTDGIAAGRLPSRPRRRGPRRRGPPARDVPPAPGGPPRTRGFERRLLPPAPGAVRGRPLSAHDLLRSAHEFPAGRRRDLAAPPRLLHGPEAGAGQVEREAAWVPLALAAGSILLAGFLARRLFGDA